MMNAADNTPTLDVLLGQAGYGARDEQGRWLSDGHETEQRARIAGLAAARELARMAPGARVRFKHDVDRYPHFIVDAGELGTVVDHGDPSIFAVRLDELVEGAEDWENECHWVNGDNPLDDLELVDVEAERLRDVETLRASGSPAARVEAARIERELADAYALERDAKRAGDPYARDRARARIAEAQAAEAELNADDEQDAAYERVSFPKVELEPEVAAFIVENLDYLAGVDEGEHTDRERLLEVARELDDKRAIARAGALGVELAFSLRGEPVFDAGFVNLMLDELEALPPAERPAAVRAVNDGSSVTDRRAYEERAES